MSPQTSLCLMQGTNLFPPTHTLCIYAVLLLRCSPRFLIVSFLICNISSLSPFLTEDGSKGIRTLKFRAPPFPSLPLLHQEPCACSEASRDVTLSRMNTASSQISSHFVPSCHSHERLQENSGDRCLLPGRAQPAAQLRPPRPRRHLTTKPNLDSRTLCDFCPTPQSFKVIGKKDLKGVKQRNNLKGWQPCFILYCGPLSLWKVKNEIITAKTFTSLYKTPQGFWLNSGM